MKILFTGYAPVHFVCFQPLYKRLVKITGMEVFVSGGLRSRTDDGVRHDEQAMYEPFGIPPERILSVETIRQLEFDVVFAANTKVILPQRVGCRVQIFHGMSFRNRAVRAENKNCDYYFMTGPYMRRQFSETGIIPDGDERAMSIGFMKTDRLLNGTLDREGLLARYGFDGTRPVVLYAPTGLRHNSMETMGEKVIERLAATGRYDLLIKLHDHPKNTKIDWSRRLARFVDGHCVIASGADVVPLLFLADLLISDASSVSNEYALLDRPTVFLDVPRLITRAHKRAGSMLDLDTWGRKGGVVVERPEELVEAVEHSLDHPAEHHGIRQRMAQDLFYNPGRATDVAMAWLTANTLSAAGSPSAARAS